MRIGMVSDIHCNIVGLRLALEAMGPIDALLSAGDNVFQFRWSNDVVALLKETGAYVVQGNHDEIILGPSGVRALAIAGVDLDLVAWLRQQPFRRELEFDGKKILLTHGSPWAPYWDYIYPHQPAWKRAETLDCDVVVVGHTHFQMAQRFGKVLVINPGSCGDPRDPRNNFKLSCAVWDSESGEVTFYDYDDPARHAGNPNAAT